MARVKKEEIDHLKTYEHWGVEFKNRDSKEVEKKGSCPFCGGSALHVRSDEGMFHCKTCEKQGNKYTFIQLYYDMWLETTTAKDYKKLSKDRGLPSEAFSLDGYAWDKNLEVWLLPSRNEKGSMVNLFRWSMQEVSEGEGRPVIGTAALKTHLGGLDEIEDNRILNLCEGPWDKTALKYLLHKTEQKDQCVLWAPGASTFKDEWVETFDGKDVRFFYDNDDPGKSGQKKAVSKIHERSKAKSIHATIWPESYPDGFDVRDHVSKTIKAPKKAYRTLQGLLEAVTKQKKNKSTKVYKSFEELVTHFRKQIYMTPNMEDGLLLILATVFSNIIFPDPYCPIWLFLTGNSGGGKTLLLQSVSGYEKVVTRDKITANNLVSLYKTPDGSDPSLLPDLIGNTFLMKDWTVIMRLPPSDQDIIHSVMRAAFDGRFDSSSGIGINRSYPDPDSEHDTCHFTFLAGVTNDIYLENRTSVGERTLKFQIIQDLENVIPILQASTKNTLEATSPEESLREATQSFIDYKLSQELYTPSLSPAIETKVQGVAQFSCIVGATAHRKQGELLLRPSPAIASRMSKQLIKVCQAVAFVLGKKAVDERCYLLSQRVALDTYYGWNRDTIIGVAQANGEGAFRDDLVRSMRMSPSTATRSLENMYELGALEFEEETGKQGKPRKKWFLSKSLQQLWDMAKVDVSTIHKKPILRRKKRGKDTLRAKLKRKFVARTLSTNRHSSLSRKRAVAKRK